MYGKKKQNKERRSNDSHQQLLSMGLVQPDNENSDDDAALEAELQKLMYGGSKAAKVELSYRDLIILVGSAQAQAVIQF